MGIIAQLEKEVIRVVGEADKDIKPDGTEATEEKSDMKPKGIINTLIQTISDIFTLAVYSHQHTFGLTPKSMNY